jgi:hypothetical protein
LEPFFFAEDVMWLQLYLSTQLEDHQSNVARFFREFLDKHFLGRCAGRDGPALWPLCSPHIMPLDIFLW